MQEGQKELPQEATSLHDMQAHTEEVNVFNLSSRSISDDCLSAQNRGLSFAPTAHCLEFDVHVDIHFFFFKKRL